MSEEPPAQLALSVTPRGDLRLAPERGESHPLGAGEAAALRRAFERGRGHGVLHLGAVQATRSLPPSLGFWRDLGRLFLGRLCRRVDLERERSTFTIACPREEIAALLAARPPMTGGEYLGEETLAAVWRDVESACRRELAEHAGSVEEFLHERNPAWNLIGRIHFHLAEQKGDVEKPFAFLATYATRLGARSSVKHVPLGKALSELSSLAPGDRREVIEILKPLRTLTQRSECVREFVESGRIFHPFALSAEGAYRFLRDIPVCEECGIVVKVPDWWRSRATSRPRVRVTIGSDAPSRLGLEGLLDFSVQVVLADEPLSRREVEQILAETEGLALVRGRWTEIDPEQLRDVLDQWEALEAASREGITVAEGLRLLSGADLDTGATRAGETSDGAAEWSERVAGGWLAEAIASLRRPGPGGDIALEEELRATLRPYQRSGVQWLWTLHRLGLGGCLADDMGLGKTIQVLALLLLLRNEKPDATSLVVVPASLLANWSAEIERFTPDLDALVLHPSAMARDAIGELSPRDLLARDLVITSYGYLGRIPAIESMQWDLVVLDEAQAIKNPATRQARRVKSLASRSRLALTGTPVENRLADLWSLFDFLNPGLLGSAATFRRFTRSLQEHGSNRYLPLRRLISPYILRRLKSDRSIVPDLPDKTEVPAYAPLTKKQAVLYDQSVRELARELEKLAATSNDMKRRGLVLSFLTRFKQICNHPSQWLADGDYSPAASGKFARLAQLCEEIASRQEKVLVFTQYRELTAPLADHLSTVFGKPGLRLDGSTAVRKRPSLVEAFQDDENVPFFVISLRAGGTGLNLTAASHVIHFDRWWNPAVEDQATDRAYRIGQHRNVMVHKFICRGTVEEKIDELIRSKQELSRELLEGTGETTITELEDQQLLELVSLDLDRAMGDTGR